MTDNDEKNKLVLPSLLIAISIIFFALSNRVEVLTSDNGMHIKVNKLTGQTWIWKPNDDYQLAWIPMYEDF